MAQGGTSAMLHSVLIPWDPVPIRLASGNSEKLLERKWLVLSNETETDLGCSLQDPKSPGWYCCLQLDGEN